MKRLLIPPNRPLVVLDTGPARNIAHDAENGSPEPAWVGTFERMREVGYAFCLADGAFAELLTQVCEGRLSEAGHRQMVTSLERFLDADFPVLPGKRDIMGMLGVAANQDEWDEQVVRSLSERAWEMLAESKAGDDCAATELEDERGEYKDSFRIFADAWNASAKMEALHERSHSQLNLALSRQREGLIAPDMDVRNDLQTRWLWRQFVRSQKPKDGYSPDSPKKRNDGIDFDLYRYLALPALVVTTDSGFFEGLSDLKSFQKAWFWKAEELAAAFERGERPVPMWPG